MYNYRIRTYHHKASFHKTALGCIVIKRGHRYKGDFSCIFCPPPFSQNTPALTPCKAFPPCRATFVIADADGTSTFIKQEAQAEIIGSTKDRLPDAEQALKIAKELHTSIEYLLTGKNENTHCVIKPLVQNLIPKLNTLSNENLDLLKTIAEKLQG